MKTNGKRGNTRGKSYPEQSTRQALRGLRRQQGGPGLTASALSVGVGNLDASELTALIEQIRAELKA